MRVCDAHAADGALRQVTNRDGGELLARYDNNVVIQVTLCIDCAASLLEEIRKFIGLEPGKVRF